MRWYGTPSVPKIFNLVHITLNSIHVTLRHVLMTFIFVRTIRIPGGYVEVSTSKVLRYPP